MFKLSSLQNVLCWMKLYVDYMQVGFCNLIKKEKDHTNNIWVADANENSTYYLNFDSSNCYHLRNAASSIRRWADNSSLV